MSDAVSFGLAVEFLTLVIAGSIAIMPSRTIFWAPFAVLHIATLLFGIDFVVDEPSFQISEKLLLICALLAFQGVYVWLWWRDDKRRTMAMLDHHRRNSEWCKEHKELLDQRYSRPRAKR